MHATVPSFLFIDESCQILNECVNLNVFFTAKKLIRDKFQEKIYLRQSLIYFFADKTKYHSGTIGRGPYYSIYE